jgi:hypothetical protein
VFIRTRPRCAIPNFINMTKTDIFSKKDPDCDKTESKTLPPSETGFNQVSQKMKDKQSPYSSGRDFTSNDVSDKKSAIADLPISLSVSLPSSWDEEVFHESGSIPSNMMDIEMAEDVSRGSSSPRTESGSELDDIDGDTFNLVHLRIQMPQDSVQALIPIGVYSENGFRCLLGKLFGSGINDVPYRIKYNNDLIDGVVYVLADATLSVHLGLLGGAKPRGGNVVVVRTGGKQNRPKPKKRRPIVNVAIKTVSKKRSSGPRNNGVQRRNHSDSGFAFALKHPFHPDAYGCKVPDTFNQPTITSHVHYETELGTLAGQTGAQITIFPSPLISFMTRSGAIAPTLTAFGGDAGIYYFQTRATMDTIYDEYRVVAMGVKISNLQPELAATGRVIITPLILGGTFVGFDMLNNAGAPAGVNFYSTATMGLSQAQITSSAILQKPASVEITVQNLLRESIEFTMVPTNPIFYKFKNVGSQSYNTVGNIIENGEDYAVTASGLISTANTEFTDNMDMTGGVALNLLLLGAPQNTPNCLQIEVVVHIEGTPSVNSAVNAMVMSGAQPCPGSTSMVEAALGAASTNVIRALKTGFDFLSDGDNRSKLARLAGSAYRMYGNRRIGN